MIRTTFLLVALLSFLAGPAAAQSPRTIDLVEAQARTQKIAPKLLAATVGIVHSADEIEAGGIAYGGSGVIVSADGFVLTCAHVLEGAGDEVIVILDGKRQEKARVCGYLGRGDLGLVKLVGKGPWPFLPMAGEAKISPGTLCLGAGHTGRIDPGRPPPLRAGRVLGERQGEAFLDENGQAADLDRVLVTDAPFLPGDSGGPLVNLAGEVIGVHSSIGLDHRENLHVPVSQFHKHWARLTGGVKRPLPKTAGDDLAGLRMGPVRRLPIFNYRVTVERSWSMTHPNFLKRCSSYVESARAATVQIFVDDRAAALGVVVDANGLIATVADAVLLTPALSTKERGSQRIVCRIGERDYETDDVAVDGALNLFLLKIDAGGLTPVAWSDDPAPPVGSWVVSAGPQAAPLAVGVVGLPPRAIPQSQPEESARHGFLGVELLEEGKEARVARIVPASAAATAGLAINDVIQSVNENMIAGGDELVETLRQFKSGDRVRIEIVRGGAKQRLEVVLGNRPSPQEEEDAEFAAWNRSSGGVSRRKTNLPAVVTHDGPVPPRFCGGPLVDLNGRVVGLNIARADRTATYALPAETVKKALEKLQTDLGAAAEKTP